MGEIARDDVIRDLVEARRRHRPGVETCGTDAAPRGMDVRPVVVRPHQGELHPVAVRRGEESPIQRPVQKEAVFVGIPVKKEDVDAMVRRRVDLARHHGRIRFVAIPPQRHARLAVAGEARLRLANELPLGPVRALLPCVSRIARVIVAEIIRRHRGRHRVPFRVHRSHALHRIMLLLHASPRKPRLRPPSTT